MPRTVAWNQDLDIIEIIYQQDITPQDLEESTIEALKLARDHHLTRFLVDISEADLAAPLVDVYDLPDKRYEELGADRKNHLALIPSRTDKGMKDAVFYEYVSVNRGWMVKIFFTYKDAFEWLLSSQQDS